MPDIHVGSQIFDLVFHPTRSVVYTGLLSGEIKAFGYDEQGNHKSAFTIQASTRSCRGLTLSEDGDKLWAVGKGKAIHVIDTSTVKVIESRKDAHSAAINRVKRLMPNMISTGDDDGMVKLWDPRRPAALREYTHHFDFISDFLWLEDKKQLVSTSGDGTLSVIDVRSQKTQPFARSEDQEDELLSIVSIKHGQKVVVGTQIGILSIFNRKKGWGDCVDRIPGHPHSVDTLCNIPSHYPNAESTILTGSSDGLLRAVQILPTKLLGVIADHGEFPIERVAVDRGGEGRWVGSAGHEEVLKLTDLKEMFEDDGSSEDEGADGSSSGDDSEDKEEEDGKDVEGDLVGKVHGRRFESDEEDDEEEEGEDAGENQEEQEPVQEDSSDSEEEVESKKRKKKKERDPFRVVKKAKGRNEIDAEPSFFADL